MNLTDMPERVKRLPRDHRGFPIPWFVHWQDGEPDFRVIAPRKLMNAFRTSRCWICGEPLGVHRVHLIGPMCLVNRVTSEPPSHRACAEFAAKACPFLTRPRMRRNEKDLPAGRTIAGIHIDRNPGCVCLYETLRVKPFKAGAGTLFRLGEPLRIDWWAEGRQRDAGRGSGLDRQRLPHLAQHGDPIRRPRGRGRPRANARRRHAASAGGVNIGSA